MNEFLLGGFSTLGNPRWFEVAGLKAGPDSTGTCFLQAIWKDIVESCIPGTLIVSDSVLRDRPYLTATVPRCLYLDKPIHELENAQMLDCDYYIDNEDIRKIDPDWPYRQPLPKLGQEDLEYQAMWGTAAILGNFKVEQLCLLNRISCTDKKQYTMEIARTVVSAGGYMVMFGHDGNYLICIHDPYNPPQHFHDLMNSLYERLKSWIGAREAIWSEELDHAIIQRDG